MLCDCLSMLSYNLYSVLHVYMYTLLLLQIMHLYTCISLRCIFVAQYGGLCYSICFNLIHSKSEHGPPAKTLQRWQTASLHDRLVQTAQSCTMLKFLSLMLITDPTIHVIGIQTHSSVSAIPLIPPFRYFSLPIIHCT